MGSYLNPGNKGFRESLNSQIYVDKSGLIEQTNAVLDTREKYVCVSRPRRFGKSMAADMLTAYYEQNQDSEKLFKNLYIEKSPSFLTHLNKYNVLKINVQDFLSSSSNVDEMLSKFQKYIIFDFCEFSKYCITSFSVFANVLFDIFLLYSLHIRTPAKYVSVITLCLYFK